jgi:hypothetical protein
MAKPELEMEIIGEFGDTDDPVFNKLVRLIVDTIKSVHLVHAQDGRLSTAQMERGNDRMTLVILHGLEVIEGDFFDAMGALLNSAAPLCAWNIRAIDDGVLIQSVYHYDMPIGSIEV